MRAQNEYLDATENNDVEKLREISERYQALQTPFGHPPGKRILHWIREIKSDIIKKAARLKT